MKVEVFFGPDNTVMAEAHSEDGRLLFKLGGQTEEILDMLRSAGKAAEERSKAYSAALARILYSLVSWD
jgi:hypothetical protein